MNQPITVDQVTQQVATLVNKETSQGHVPLETINQRIKEEVRKLGKNTG